MIDAGSVCRHIVGDGIVVELGTLQEDTSTPALSVIAAVVCHHKVVAGTLNHIGSASITFFAIGITQVSQQVTVRNLTVLAVHIQTATTYATAMVEVVDDDEIFQFYTSEYTHTCSSVTVSTRIVDDVAVTYGEAIPFGILVILVVDVVYLISFIAYSITVGTCGVSITRW